MAETVSHLVTDSPLFIPPDGQQQRDDTTQLRGETEPMETESFSADEQPKKAWFDLQFHDANNEQIRKPDQIKDNLVDPPGKIDPAIFDRLAGSLFGLATGDALGAHVEFRPHEYLVEHPVTDFTAGGTWGLEKGQFTDDTSMALCLANSLIACHGFNPYDQLVRYKWWYRHGYMSSTGKCFDIGAATRQSVEEFEQRQKDFEQKHHLSSELMDSLADADLLMQFDVNCSADGVAGNGALMRLAPVPLFFYRHPPAAVDFAGQSGRLTHGDQKAIDACRYYAALIVAALHGASKHQLLDDAFYTNHKEWFGDEELHVDILNISRGSYKKRGGYEDGIRGGGYVVKALEAALWAFWSDENSFEKGALAAVNLGDDTDTTAAIYGQLAGAVYGLDKLPSRWTEQVYAKKYLIAVSKWLVYEGEAWQLKHPSSAFSYDRCMAWSCDDVSRWLQSLNPHFINYVDAFNKALLDGPALLFRITPQSLAQLGVTAEDHRQAIISGIEGMKKNVSPNFYKQFGDEDDFVRLGRIIEEDQTRKRSHRQEISDEAERWTKILSPSILIDGIKFIHSADQYRTFLQQILWMKHNYDPQRGSITIAESEIDPSDQEKIIKRLDRFKRETRQKRDQKVCIVRGWYKCSREDISEIEANGFPRMVTLGSDENEKGFRFKASARSAAKDVSATGGCLLMCYVILRNPVPTVIGDLGFPRRYRYYSDGQHSVDQPEYHPITHEASVTYVPPSEEVNLGLHDEFVTSHSSDIYPQMVVFLRPNLGLPHRSS